MVSQTASLNRMRIWTDGDRGECGSLKRICDGFSTGNLCDSVARKLENESERPGLEFQLQQAGQAALRHVQHG